jgi:hypothetical protein
MTPVHPDTANAARPPQSSRLLLVGGLLALAASTAWLVWVIVVLSPPKLEQLTQYSGRIVRSEITGQPPSRTLRLVLDYGGEQLAFHLDGVDRLPQRDWPAESLGPGFWVALHASRTAPGAASQAIWQLNYGRRRVLEYEDRVAEPLAEMKRQAVYAGLGVTASVLLIGAWMIRRRRR